MASHNARTPRLFHSGKGKLPTDPLPPPKQGSDRLELRRSAIFLRKASMCAEKFRQAFQTVPKTVNSESENLSQNFTGKLLLIIVLRHNPPAERLEKFSVAPRGAVPDRQSTSRYRLSFYAQCLRLRGGRSPPKSGASSRGADKNDFRCAFRTYHEHTESSCQEICPAHATEHRPRTFLSSTVTDLPATFRATRMRPVLCGSPSITQWLRRVGCDRNAAATQFWPRAKVGNALGGRRNFIAPVIIRARRHPGGKKKSGPEGAAFCNAAPSGG